MKSLLVACLLLLLFAFSVYADVPKPKTPAKTVLHTSLEIVPDATVYEAKLQISQSDFKNFRAALDGELVVDDTVDAVDAGLDRRPRQQLDEPARRRADPLRRGLRRVREVPGGTLTHSATHILSHGESTYHKFR